MDANGINIVAKALSFACRKHTGQLDDNGKDYFTTHISPIYVMIQELTQDPIIICSAILHDTLEDTKTTEEELRDNFGDEITNLILELTHEGKKDEHGYYFPRLKSKEAIMIKLLDRASNISRMDSWNEERRQHYLKKTKFWRSE
jgi:GTP diphosphokinase / guanosine-3',5'-bis(diphosphate) 3'-diphosphatase